MFAGNTTMRVTCQLCLAMALVYAVALPAVLLAQPPRQPEPPRAGAPHLEPPELPWPLRAVQWLFLGSGRWLLFGLLLAAGGLAVRARSYKSRNSCALAPAGAEPSSRVEAVPNGCSAADKDLILTDKLDEKELIDRLGAPLTTFRPHRVNLIAGIILAFLMVGGGGAGAAAIMRATHKPQDVTGATIVGIFLAGLAVGGVFLFLWVMSVISRRVLICPGGFIHISWGKAAGCCWDQISEMKVLQFSRGEDTNRKCTVRRQDGRTFVFTTNGVHGIAKLIKILSTHVGPFESGSF
jgi:hypothetical protein